MFEVPLLIFYLGLFVGPLCLLRSHRWTIGAGLLLMVSGVFLSAFSKSAMDLCLSVGVIVGMVLYLFQNIATSLQVLLSYRLFSFRVWQRINN